MEKWAAVKGFEGEYEVSTYGRVKSLKGVNSSRSKHKERILKQKVEKDGYKKVTLYKNGKGKMMQVHRVVAIAFIENDNNYPCINHKDENKGNNRLENLEWCTYVYNANYGTAIERKKKNTNYEEIVKKIDYKKIGELQSKKVYQYKINGELVRVWNSVTETQNEGYALSNVSIIARSGKGTYRGFIWTYEEKGKEYFEKYKIWHKRIEQYTLNGELVKVWERAKNVEEEDYKATTVVRCCKGKSKTHRGYIWKYEELINL